MAMVKLIRICHFGILTKELQRRAGIMYGMPSNSGRLWVSSSIAVSNSGSEGDGVDIVCSALCVKLQAKNLFSGSSCCISFGGQIFIPCQFERHAGKSSSRNWKLLICCRGKPLSPFLESYETSDDKKQFFTFDSDLGDCVPPDQPVTSPDADAVLSDASISSPDTGNYPAPDSCCSLPDL